MSAGLPVGPVHPPRPERAPYRDFTALKERAAAISEDRSLEADWASRSLADLLYEVLEALEDEPRPLVPAVVSPAAPLVPEFCHQDDPQFCRCSGGPGCSCACHAPAAPPETSQEPCWRSLECDQRGCYAEIIGHPERCRRSQS